MKAYKYVIEGVFPKQPTDALFKIIALMQKWQVLLKGEEREMLQTRIKALREWMEAFMKECKNRIQDNFI